MVHRILDHYNIKGGYNDQHFLIDNNILDEIVDAAHISSDEIILEIGPGIGNLTERLLKKAKKVIAIELDSKLIAVINDRFGDNSKLHLIHKNVLDVDLPAFDKVVANLPYSISSEITFKLLKSNFKLGILMYQYEFAQRMISAPNCSDYSRLTVNTFYFADASIIMKISKEAFSPPPAVESAVIKLVPRIAPFEVYDSNFFSKFVSAIFTKRRKKVKNAIIESNHILNINNIKKVVDKLPSDLMALRPENLTPAQIASLSNMIIDYQKEL